MKAQTSLSMPVLLLLAFIALPMQAFAYGEIRLLSKSVWTTWLLHTIANAISYALVTGDSWFSRRAFLLLCSRPAQKELAIHC